MIEIKTVYTISNLLQIHKMIKNLQRTIPPSYSSIDFECNEDIKDLCFYRLQVIGEYINKILKSEPDVLLTQKEKAYWGQIIGLRNRLSHCYGEIDPLDIWDIVKRDLPILKKDINSVIGNSKICIYENLDYKSKQEIVLFKAVQASIYEQNTKIPKKQTRHM